MIVPFALLLAALAGVFAALTNPALTDLVMLAGPCALAALILLLRAIAKPVTRRPDKWPTDRQASTPTRHRPKPRLLGRPQARAANHIVIDGSNVLYWKGNTPDIETLRDVVQHLEALGYAPGVVFDANAGYKISGKYQHDKGLGRLIGLPEDRVLVVPKGTPADPVILEAARDLGARIVTNDRYRDWAEAHPEIHTKGHLVSGDYVDGQLRLDIAQTKAATA